MPYSASAPQTAAADGPAQYWNTSDHDPPDSRQRPDARLCARRGGAQAEPRRRPRVRKEAGVKILLATKAWAMPAAFPLMRDVLDGNGVGRVRGADGARGVGREVHVYAPAYGPGEIERLTGIADHIYANSPEQMAKVISVVRALAARGFPSARINPGYSNATVGGALYDPCAPAHGSARRSRTSTNCRGGDIDIFHVHSLCEVAGRRIGRPDRARRAPVRAVPAA